MNFEACKTTEMLSQQVRRYLGMKNYIFFLDQFWSYFLPLIHSRIKVTTNLGNQILMSFKDQKEESNMNMKIDNFRENFMDSTSLFDSFPKIRMVNDDEIYEVRDDCQIHSFQQDSLSDRNHDSLIRLLKTIQNPEPIESSINGSTQKSSNKNSNVIKKIGRIIINNLEKYDLTDKINTGVVNMLKMLQERSQGRSDGFNTYHLQSLFDVEDEQICKHNMKVTRNIFSKQIRKEVLKSYQIRGFQKKLLYMNTLKCSSLRFVNKKLANRLQTSENQH